MTIVEKISEVEKEFSELLKDVPEFHEPIKINPVETILDCRKFVETTICYCKNNYQNPRFDIYLEQLIELSEYLKHNTIKERTMNTQEIENQNHNKKFTIVDNGIKYNPENLTEADLIISRFESQPPEPPPPTPILPDKMPEKAEKQPKKSKKQSFDDKQGSLF